MYHKVKNTLVSLAVALCIVGLSYSIGHPPRESIAPVNFAAPGIDASLSIVQFVL